LGTQIDEREGFVDTLKSPAVRKKENKVPGPREATDLPRETMVPKWPS